MTIESYTNDVILDDLRRLQYLYGLKKEIRYNLNREQTDDTESVAEHIYGMHILAQYFLALEDASGSADRVRIYEMITAHDLDEIETGDVLGYTKTDAMRDAEKAAMLRVIAKSPVGMQSILSARAEEYEAKETWEALFTRAIDKVEPIVHTYTPDGKAIFARNKTTKEQSWRIKEPHVAPFPFIKKFAEVTHQAMDREGYFFPA